MRGHMPVEGGAMSAIWIHQPYLRLWGSMTVDELRQVFGHVAVIQQVAAYDQVVLAGQHGGVVFRVCNGLAAPLAVLVAQQRQVVQAGVLVQEGFSKWVAIAGGNTRAAMLGDQAGQPQAAADFQNAFVGTYRARGQSSCQLNARRPDHAEQWPGGRVDAAT